MNYKKYYGSNHTYIERIDSRLNMVISIAIRIAPKSMLDVGCGEGVLLNALAGMSPQMELTGTDVYEQTEARWKYAVSDVTEGLNFSDDSFDLVVIAEIIEPVPDPDSLLTECRRVLKPGGNIIVTTPNLVSWANRLLVLTGTQPLFTESSTKSNLGRRYRFLGQGQKVQGHLKIFTHRSLREILELHHYEVSRRRGTTFFFPFPLNFLDRMFSKFISLASGLVFTGQVESAPSQKGEADRPI